MEQEKKWCVYIHQSPSDKAYIGIASGNVENRWQNGLGYLKKTKYGEYKQPAIARAIKKYSWDSFKHIIWVENLTKEEACEYERLLIKLFDTRNPKYGYNIRQGGSDGGSGRVVSETTKLRLSISHKGKTSPNKGKSLSEEHKQKLCVAFANSPNRGDEWRNKLSESHRGKKVSDETKHLLSKIRQGHTVSDETREKISKSRMGKSLSKETIEKIGKALRKEAFVCIETGVIYPCAYAVELELGIKNVKRACIPNSGRKTAGGFHWRVATEEEMLLCE